jgi:predicted phosphodiesterase
VFGNNDGDLYRIAANARHYENIRLHGELFRGEFDGHRFAMNHYDGIARALAASGEFDVVCYGHNQVFDIARIGATLAINPGAIMGATFAPDGSRTDVPSTFVVYETVTGHAAQFQV